MSGSRGAQVILILMFWMVLLETSGCSLQNWLKQNYGPKPCPKFSPPLVSVIKYFTQTVAYRSYVFFLCQFVISQAVNTFFLSFSTSILVAAARKMQKGILDLKLMFLSHTSQFLTQKQPLANKNTESCLVSKICAVFT